MRPLVSTLAVCLRRYWQAATPTTHLLEDVETTKHYSGPWVGSLQCIELRQTGSRQSFARRPYKTACPSWRLSHGSSLSRSRWATLHKRKISLTHYHPPPSRVRGCTLRILADGWHPLTLPHNIYPLSNPYCEERKRHISLCYLVSEVSTHFVRALNLWLGQHRSDEPSS